MSDCSGIHWLWPKDWLGSQGFGKNMIGKLKNMIGKLMRKTSEEVDKSLQWAKDGKILYVM